MDQTWTTGIFLAFLN